MHHFGVVPTWPTAGGIFRPPDAPSASLRSPLESVMMAGVAEERGLFPP